MRPMGQLLADTARPSPSFPAAAVKVPAYRRVMDTAHPFMTKQDVKRRRRQRRLLAALPDGAVKPIADLGPLPATPDPGLVEEMLREQADAVTKKATHLIDGVKKRSALSSTLEYVHHAQNRQNRVLTESFAVFEERLVALQKANRSDGTDLTTDRDFVQLVALLIWADDLAPDGYADRRVAVARGT